MWSPANAGAGQEAGVATLGSVTPAGAAELAENTIWFDDGDQEGAEIGYSVAGAGDVNGDGYADVVVGAPLYDSDEGNAGLVALYYGTSAGLSAEPAWIWEGDQTAGQLGVCVAGAGDVNNDGYDDIIVGAGYYDMIQLDEGRVCVFYGSAGGPPDTPSWEIGGDIIRAILGQAVSGAGDVNGDGYDDVIIGSFNYRSPEVKEGRAYIYHGGPSGLSSTPSWIAEGNQEYGYFAMSVAGVGDVNNDGYDDVIIGATAYDVGPYEDAGRTYVYLGDSTGVAEEPAWIFEGDQTNENLGRGVAGAGDINNDGYDDVIVGAPGYDGNDPNEGIALVFHGTPAGVSSEPAWTIEGNNAEAQFGYSVAGIGDVNNDGYDDAAVGGPGYSNGFAGEGRAFVYLGSAAGLGLQHAWSGEGNCMNAAYGLSVAGAGDIDDDGYDDLAAGAPEYTDDQINEGRIFAYLMGPDTTPPAVEVKAPNGGETWYTGNEYIISWTAADWSGVDFIDLYYSLDGGDSYTVIAEGEPNDETHSWSVPEIHSDSALIRIVAYDPNSLWDEDTSDGFFHLLPDTVGPAVTIVAPNGGETFYIGNDHEITWIATDDNGVDSISVLYSLNKGKDYTPVATGEPNDSTLTWTVPDNPSTKAMIKIEAYDTRENMDCAESAATFTIAADTEAPEVVMVSPNGGEFWPAGTPQTIEWVAADNTTVDSVSVLYSVDGGEEFTLISAGESNDSAFVWVVPAEFSENAVVKVIAYDRFMNAGDDVSNGAFAIVPDTTGPSVSVGSPNGGETWGVGSLSVITWTADDPAGVDSVSIIYSVDGGDTYHLISSGEANDSSFLWEVPDAPSDSALIRVIAYDKSQNAGQDASDSLFVISGGLVDVSGLPGAGESVRFWGAAPNPAVSGTEIVFYLPAERRVHLEIFDAAGRLVARLADGAKTGPGIHRMPWDGRKDGGGRLGSGVYFCLLRTEGFAESKKIVLAR